MEDDSYFGAKSCLCVPRRLVVIVLAAFFVFSALGELAYLFYISLGASLTPSHCVGHRCWHLVTCEGEVESSFNVRMVLMTLGGLVFGYWGLNGSMQGRDWQLINFAVFLVVAAIANLLLAAWDGVYWQVCSSYSWNTLSYAVLWPFPNWPVEEKAKDQIREFATSQILKTYPANIIDGILRNASITYLYILRALMSSGIYLWGARDAYYMAYQESWGVLGLGRNYDIATWRDNLFWKKDLDRIFAKVQREIKDGKDEISTLTFGEVPPPRYNGPPPLSRAWLAARELSAPQYT